MNQPLQVSPIFPPTPRQQWILLLTIPLLAVVSVFPISRIFLLLISPWILGVMVMLFDRAGPVRNWLGSVVHAVFYPLALIIFNWRVVEQWMRCGWLQEPLIVGALDVVLLASFVFSLYYLTPQRCPSCEQRSLIPLMPWIFREQRSNSTHWCASCGSQYWKYHGAWEPERRTTWWDSAVAQRGQEQY